MSFYTTVILILTSYIFSFSQNIQLVDQVSVNLSSRKECFPKKQRDLHLNHKAKGSYKSSSNTEFIIPLQADTSFKHNGFYSISNYVDHNHSTGAVEDYNCGDRTYDLQTGYNHQGTDFSLWPFGWEMMDNNAIHVVAAAGGTIIDKIDGNPDENCDFTNPFWNAIYIEHDDGSEAYYGHLKRESLTFKSIGERVEQGEFLGIVGSSGQSTGPHLHFEVVDQLGNLIDPYHGTCNSVTSWWKNQRDYRDPKALRLDCHSAPPVMGACKGETIYNRKHFYRPGDSIYFISYYRDLTDEFMNTYQVTTPSGEIFTNWEYTSTLDVSNSAYLTWLITLPSNAELGIWDVELVFNNDTLVDHFEVVDSPVGINEPHLVLDGINQSFFIDQNLSKIKIYSLDAKLIEEIPNYSQGIPIKLKSGLYIVQMQLSQGGIITKRVKL